MGVAFTRRRIDDTSTLRQGLVGAWCPSLPNGGSGNMLPDVSGYGNHGTLTNMSPDDWVSSQYGRALDFDGVNDRVNCGRPAVIDSLVNNYSLFAWVKPTGSFVNYRNIVAKSTGLTAQFGIIVFQTGVWYTQTTDNLSTTGGTLSLDSWFHVGYTFANGVMTTYQNGVAQNTRSGATNASIVADFKIGNDELPGSPTGSAPRPFLGQIDDVRLYSKVLSPSEIRLLASRPGIGLQNPQDDFLYYPFPSGSRRRRLLTGMP